MDRLLARREVTASGCWLYVGALDDSGYGLIGWRGRHWRVHRLAYELLVGPIPPRMVSDHECHNRSTCKGGKSCPHRRCFNPEHLAIVPPAVNNASGRQGAYLSARVQCPAGHDQAVHGVVYPSSKKRECRECKRVRSLAFYRSRK